jgi:hypothetical protein
VALVYVITVVSAGFFLRAAVLAGVLGGGLFSFTFLQAVFL